MSLVDRIIADTIIFLVGLFVAFGLFFSSIPKYQEGFWIPLLFGLVGLGDFIFLMVKGGDIIEKEEEERKSCRCFCK